MDKCKNCERFYECDNMGFYIDCCEKENPENTQESIENTLKK